MSPFLITLLVIGLLIPILPNLWAIWNAFHSEFASVEEKMSWIAAGVFLPVLGGLLYVFWGRRRRVT
jgi:hypothetical protein